MAYFDFINGETPINDTNLNTMQKGLMELVFPIGSTYTTQDANTNPSTILGFGTWERLKGKVTVGLDEDDEDFNEIGKTGGEKTHKLTIDEMPSHAHQLSGAGNAYDWGEGGDRFTINNPSIGYTVIIAQNTTKVGSDKGHNNLQPYEVVGYVWKRIA